MPRPARPWFRAYSEALDNPKLQRLKPSTGWAWFKLMCLANLSTPRGSLPPVRDIAFRLRVTEKQAQAFLDELLATGLVEKTGRNYEMHDWDEWQYESDARATEGRKLADGRTSRSADRRGDITAEPPQNRRAITAESPRPAEVARHRSDQSREETDQSRTDARDPVDQLVADFASFGAVNGNTADLIQEAVEDHGLELVQQAVKKAKGADYEGTPPWNYVLSILERKGVRHERNTGQNGNGDAPDPGLAAREAEREATRVRSPFRP